ncbi:MAG: tyrosine--tRNA ligase, partial [Bacteroidaceae bacterium]|nr:tyrosine--tRNA ligase [Bacteroidaceae bacterium]
CGHKPLALIGGATGMIGDPSGKSQERNLLNEETLRHNVACIKEQLARFLDFDSDAPNKAELVNNYDWMREYSFLDFAREIGKCITVNYMMAKDSVKRRLNGEFQDGMSFTEFTYQLLQGYDFLHLYQTKNCKLQMGGSDQWGNITTGTELIRRKLGSENEAFALTCPLITKADGKKFGKTEQGNIWLDRNRTTPYAFYQFWLNVADEDAERYIKIFTSLDQETISSLVQEHSQDPGRRILQKRLAEEVTVMVHGRQDYEMAVEASNILFGKATKESLTKLDEQTLLDVMNGVPQYEFDRTLLQGEGVKAVNLTTEAAPCFPSKGEMRKLTQGGGVSLNKEKLTAFDQLITEDDLLDGKYLLVQQGKKKYFLLIAK